MSNVVPFGTKKPKIKLASPKQDEPITVTLASLALAIDYYTHVVPDEDFVKVAKPCLATCNDNKGNRCTVTEAIRKDVQKRMAADLAVKSCLLGFGK